MSVFDMCNACDLPVTTPNPMGYCDGCLTQCYAATAAAPLRKISCGCCNGGCVCFMHQDVPMGRPQTICSAHRGGL